MGAISSCVELVTERLSEDVRSTVDRPSLVRECLEDMETINFCTSPPSVLGHREPMLTCARVGLQHMRRLVEETLSVSKIEHDFLTLTFEPFEPKPLVRKTVKMYEAEMSSKGIECRIDSEGEADDIWLSSDHARIMQVLINFLSNAIKATARTTGTKKIVVTVRVTANRPVGEQYALTKGQELADEEDARETHKVQPSANGANTGNVHGRQLYLEVAVTDTGDGLDDEQKQKVFQRFSRTLPRTQVSYGVSHGLGLYISRRIASVLGGTLSCYIRPFRLSIAD